MLAVIEESDKEEERRQTMIKLEAGDIAPDFSLKDTDGNLVRLSDFRGSKEVLYFYPKDNTPGCTTEACNFRDDYELYSKDGVVILGVSGDSAESHGKFRDKFGLPFPLLCDEEHNVAASYGAYGEKNMYGRKKMGIIRKTFLIDEEGKIKKAWHKVKVEGHSSELLAEIATDG